MQINNETANNNCEYTIGFVITGINSPMFLIQSYPILSKLKNKYKFIIISIEDAIINNGIEEDHNTYTKISEHFQTEILLFKKIPLIPKVFAQIILLTPKLYELFNQQNIHLALGRGYLPSILLGLVSIFKRIHYIFDLRGVFVDELKLRYNLKEKNPKIMIWRLLERFALNRCAEAVVVSKPFQKYVHEINSKIKIKIIRNAVVRNSYTKEEYNTIRINFRKQLNINNRIVWVYSGSLFKWQLIPEMLGFFRKALDNNPELFLLFLTPKDSNKVKEMIKYEKIPEQCYHISSVPPDEIGQYLTAGDIGVLLRENNIVNQVSNPLKFAEYIHAGLWVLTSDRIGDTSEIVRRYNIGTIINPIEKESFLKNLDTLYYSAANRNPLKIIDVARNEFDFGDAVQAYDDLFANLVKIK